MANRIQGWSPTHISEYSYGLGLSIELVHALGGMANLTAAPLVPNLYHEAELGFDLALQAQWLLVCLQFKVPTRLVRSNAGQAQVFGVPYYRFPVKTDATGGGNCQHNTLCRLQDDLRGTGYVYYAAPIFDTHAEFDRYARAGQLVARSVFVEPQQMGPQTVGSLHSFAYRTEHDIRAFSEPGPSFSGSFAMTLDRLLSSQAEQQSLGDFLRGCDQKLSAAAGRRLLQDSQPGTASAQAALSLDVQPFVVGIGEDLPPATSSAASPLDLEATQLGIRSRG